MCRTDFNISDAFKVEWSVLHSRGIVWCGNVVDVSSFDLCLKYAPILVRESDADICSQMYTCSSPVGTSKGFEFENEHLE